jgi:hypothetical protein
MPDMFRLIYHVWNEQIDHVTEPRPSALRATSKTLALSPTKLSIK